ncbi:MAG: DUF6273 domain-containing protein [Bacilli bacterium]|nr:DUF6273 domain-containing protein [Bacilli bacterium]
MSCSGNGSYVDGRETVEFGSYPQARVTDNATISDLDAAAGALPTTSDDGTWTDYGYYRNESVVKIMWFKDVEYNNAKYRGVHMVSYRPRETRLGKSTLSTVQDNNGYLLTKDADGNYVPKTFWFKYEPIKWVVLDTKETGEKLLNATIGLDAQDFHHTAKNGDNNYANSFIRGWMNNDFYNAAFTAEDQAKVLTTEVDNSKSSTSDFDIELTDYGCENTNDKVFLLSFQELMKYMPTNDSRVRYCSEYAKCQGAFADGMISDSDLYEEAKSTDESAEEESEEEEEDVTIVGATEWWLRSPSPSKTTYNVWRVRSTGAFDLKTTIHTEYSILPAIWLAA